MSQFAAVSRVRFAPDEADRLLDRMLGGAERFARTEWRSRYFVARGAALELPAYETADYLRDLVASHPAPYSSVHVRDGHRVLDRHPTIDDLLTALGAGDVSAMKISRLWHEPAAPESWLWMRDLLGALARAVAMVYLTPVRSEDVDLFLAGPDSQLGRHYDSTDVFTIQLVGERRWTFDRDFDLSAVLRQTGGKDWDPAAEMSFTGETVEIVLQPGDLLYVPAHNVHQVTGVTWSVALSLGLRAVHEIDLVEHLLDRIRQLHFSAYSPLPSVPDSVEDQQVAGKFEVMARVRDLLALVESATWAALMDGLQLPEDLRGAPVSDR